MNFLGSSDSKELACKAGDLGSSPGSGRSPGEGNGNPLQYPCLENPYRQWSLVNYSLWGHTTCVALVSHKTLVSERVRHNSVTKNTHAAHTL